MLDHFFSPAGEALASARGFDRSPLLIGGDWDAVPAKLRPYVDDSLQERTLRVTVRLLGACSAKHLSVSGDGVTVASARHRPIGRCALTLRVAPAAAGRRSRPRGRRLWPTTIIRGAIRLGYA